MFCKSVVIFSFLVHHKTFAMKLLSVCILLILIISSCSKKQNSEKEWIQLFNGKNLDGWDMKFTGYPLNENYKNTFRVEDGLLKVRYDEYDSLGNVFGHLITKQSFSHYKIRAEYRFVGAQIKGAPVWGYRNNGIMVHCQSAGSMTLDQDFPVSIEVQLLGGIGNDDRTNMNVCTPGTLIDIDGKEYTDHCFKSRSKVKNGEQWTIVEAEVYGDSIIRHIVDGQVVLEYTCPRLDPLSPFYQKLLSPETGARLTKGKIAIQAESHPTDFRKIELLDLTDGCDIDAK
jgi:hypothetical protein